MVKNLLALGSMFLFTLPARAQTTSQVYGDAITKQTQTFFITTTADWTTYNSSAVESNTTGTTSSVTVGGFAGENRSLGVFLASTNQDLDFKLNDSRIRNDWYDLRFQARLGYVFPSVGVSLSETKMQMGDDEAVLMDAYGRGINAGLAIKIPLNDKIMIHADSLVVKTNNSVDKNAQDVEMDIRQEANVHASFDVTKNMVDFLIGYRARKFNIKIDDQEYEEVQSAPFAGLRLGTYF